MGFSWLERFRKWCHAQIGAFKVVSEAGIASGVRRIEAVVGPAAVEYLNEVDSIVQKLASQFKVKPEELPSRVAGTLAGFQGIHSIHRSARFMLVSAAACLHPLLCW